MIEKGQVINNFYINAYFLDNIYSIFYEQIYYYVFENIMDFNSK